jgi:hypothetical protein
MNIYTDDNAPPEVNRSIPVHSMYSWTIVHSQFLYRIIRHEVSWSCMYIFRAPFNHFDVLVRFVPVSWFPSTRDHHHLLLSMLLTLPSCPSRPYALAPSWLELRLRAALLAASICLLVCWCMVREYEERSEGISNSDSYEYCEAANCEEEVECCDRGYVDEDMMESIWEEFQGEEIDVGVRIFGVRDVEWRWKMLNDVKRWDVNGLV